jgi:hypothetical protein
VQPGLTDRKFGTDHPIGSAGGELGFARGEMRIFTSRTKEEPPEINITFPGAGPFPYSP